MKNDSEIAAAILDAQVEILADVAAGNLPETVGTFSELHDFVDANEYAGFCDTARRGSWESEDCNRVQNGVNAWLESRGTK